MKKLTIAMLTAIPLSTMATPVATPVAHPKCGAAEWLLIEKDSDGKEIQSQCVETPVCPLDTEVVEVNIGRGGDYIVCRPCDKGADCNREFP